MEKVTLIVTVKNEAKTIRSLLRSIEQQLRQPDEVIIVDGGSSDETFSILSAWKPKFAFSALNKAGNRSIGRNEAIERAMYSCIAITDAGCVLDSHWLEEIVLPFSKGADVVAGYYASKAATSFEQAASAYMLVMPKQVNVNNFLPATRSMALTKNIWREAGKFPERFTFNEDYVFAQKLRKIGARFAFTQNAIVYWQPPQSWKQFLVQVYKFAYGDMAASIIRPKVLLIFARYILFVLLLGFLPTFFVFLLGVYLVWSIVKNMRYVRSMHAVYLLPIMQIATDLTVMLGSTVGFLQKGRYELSN